MSVEFETAGNPHGEHGRTMLARMNESHEPLTEWALDLITFNLGDHVLDIGCGGGKTIQRILRRLADVGGGHVTGIDHSALCVQESSALNKGEIESGLVEVHEASISNLPFNDNAFDIVTGFETIYFWPTVVSDLREALRVIKSGGTFLLANDDSVPETEEIKEVQRLVEVDMTIFTPDELVRLVEGTGFVDVALHSQEGSDRICVTAKKP